MSEWVKKSINLANSHGYLDKLYKVYPVDIEGERDLPENAVELVKKAYQSKDRGGLLRALVALPRFPLDDAYIASLKRHPHLVDYNPKTVDRITDRLFAMGLKDILTLSAKPKSSSRKMGPTFKNWLKTINIPFVDGDQILKATKPSFLSGGDAQLRDFAKNELFVKGLKKGFDFLLKVKHKYFLGEAKFLTDYGGTQNNQFNSALELAKINKSNIKGLAVLDGVVWFDSNNYMHKKIKKFRGTAFSALLLKEFISNQ